MKKTIILLSTLLANQSFAINLPEHALQDYECANCTKLSHDSIKTSWLINEPLAQGLKQSVQSSKQYHLVTDGKSLQKGVTIYTSAPGAVIRISPFIKSEKHAFHLTKDAVTLPLEKATSLQAEKGVFFQIKPELGKGAWTISTHETIKNPEGKWLITVLDRGSPIKLTVGSNKAHYQYNDEIITTIKLTDDNESYPISLSKAYLVSPDDKKIPLNLEWKDTGYEAKTHLISSVNTEGKNWTIQAEISTIVNGEVIKRSGKSTFSYAIPSATLLSLKKINNTSHFQAAIRVSTESRYAVQAVLYIKEGEKFKPVEIAQSSQYIKPGDDLVEFHFTSKPQGEIYLDNIQIIDYGQMKPVYEYNSPIPFK